MSAIIKREAVSPPTIFSLRKMTHPSPNRNGAKGSYLVHDPQQNADDLFLEKMVNGVGGSAPGSPGSVQDYKQVAIIETHASWQSKLWRHMIVHVSQENTW